MLYSFFLSKKGYTFVEVLIVVTVLGILVAIGVPVFTSAVTAQKISDCNNQRTVIQSTVQEAMVGMLDNGKKQPKIYFERIQDDYEGNFTDLPDEVKTKINAKVSSGELSCTNCLVLIEDQQIPGRLAFTLGQLRGGYRPSNISDYRDGCNEGYFLKKKKYEANKFYLYVTDVDGSMPKCPFEDEDHKYYYYIFEDGSVYCSNPKCN